MIAQVIGADIPWDSVDTRIRTLPDVVIWFTLLTDLGTLREAFVYPMQGVDTYCTYVYALDESGDDLGDVLLPVAELDGKVFGRFMNVQDLMAHQVEGEYDVLEIPRPTRLYEENKVIYDNTSPEEETAAYKRQENIDVLEGWLSSDYQEIDLTKYYYAIGIIAGIAAIIAVLYIALT